jgi:hypothetical protein
MNPERRGRCYAKTGVSSVDTNTVVATKNHSANRAAYATAVMTLAYAPMLAWGPLLLLVTAAYYVRRRRT